MSFTIKEVTEVSGFTISKNSITKVMEFLIHSDDFLKDADTQEFDDYDLKLTLDEVKMQQEVIPFFLGITPLFYEFSLSSNHTIFLYVTDLKADQINWEDWKITVTFGIPEDNGQRFGGGGGWTGPNNGEYNSQEFTQVSVNCTAGWESRQLGIVEEAQRKIGQPGTLLPRKKLHPIGESPEGIEGAEQPVRSFTIDITQYCPPQKLGYAYTRRLSRLVTCLNLTPFFGFAPGSVMCVGTNFAGHLYQNVPLTLQFEVRPNFKIKQSGTMSLAPLDDVYIDLGNGLKTVDTSLQYDTYIDPDFPDTDIEHPPGFLPRGVHSGFSIVSYRYAQEVRDTEKSVIRTPIDRIIYLPEECFFVDFSEFLL